MVKDKYTAREKFQFVQKNPITKILNDCFQLTQHRRRTSAILQPWIDRKK
jgi:hypothetical protein